MTMAWRAECSLCLGYTTREEASNFNFLIKCPPRVVTTRHLQVKGNGDQGGGGRRSIRQECQHQHAGEKCGQSLLQGGVVATSE